MNYIEFDNNRKFDITILGRASIDMIPTDFFKTLDECSTFKKYIGGSPANIAIGMARLGRSVGFIGKVSDDSFGNFVLKGFEKEGIDTTHISKTKNSEKISLAFSEVLEGKGNNLIMYRNKAADLSLDISDIDEEYIKLSKLLFISGTALAASPSREAVLKAVELAKKSATKIVFNLDYRAHSWQDNKEVAKYYSLVTEQSDIVIGLREEYDLMETELNLSGNDEDSAKYWLSKGAKLVVIRHGDEGSATYTDKGESFFIKPFPVDNLKGLGGGDGYIVSFINGLFAGMEIIDAMEMGSAHAAMLVASRSISEDMPTLEEVEEFLEMAKDRYGEMIARV